MHLSYEVKQPLKDAHYAALNSADRQPYPSDVLARVGWPALCDSDVQTLPMVSKDGSLTDVMVAGLSPGHCLTSQDEETGLRRKILSTCEESLVNFDDLCGTTLASPRTSDLPDVMCLYDLWGSIIERRPAFASKFVTWLEANPDMQRAQAAAIASIRPARTLEIDHLAVQYCLEHELITPEMKLYVQGQLSRRPPWKPWQISSPNKLV